MQLDRFTQKSQEAIQSLQNAALDFGNQEIEQEHLIYVLLEQEDSLIAQLIQKAGIDRSVFRSEVEAALNKRPKVSGGQQYIGQYLNNTLNYASDEAKRMGTSISPWSICSSRCSVNPVLL
jgi:ATP-dependent Clp protease ATP-binding subunit ClpB